MDVTSARWILLAACFFSIVSADQKNITAESGQNVTLTCGASNKNIIGVEWSRADLEPEFVLMYRDGHFVPDDQHPSFKNRVDLQDRQMKDGDVSLILKDVTINDAGTYECRVFLEEKNRRKRAHLDGDPISVISLRVDPPGQTGGHTEEGGKKDGGKEDGGKKDGGKEDGGKEAGYVGLIVGVVVSAVLLLAVVGVLIYKKRKRQEQASYEPPVELQPV